MHPLLEKRIVDLPHASPRPLLHPLDCRFGRKTAINRRVDASRPTLVVREHPVRLENLLMLAAGPELGVARHVVDLLAHLAERRVDALPLGFDVLSDSMLNNDAWLVEDGDALRDARHELHSWKS